MIHGTAVAGRKTSISLEAPYWAALKRAAATRGQSLAALITEIAETRLQRFPDASNLSAALRLFILETESKSRPDAKA